MSDIDPEGFTRYGGDCICGAVYTYGGTPEPGQFAPDCPDHGEDQPMTNDTPTPAQNVDLDAIRRHLADHPNAGVIHLYRYLVDALLARVEQAEKTIDRLMQFDPEDDAAMQQAREWSIQRELAETTTALAAAEERIAAVSEVVEQAERTYVASAHKPNIDYEGGFIDLMRFTRAALGSDGPR